MIGSILYNRSFIKDCLVSRNPKADFQQLYSSRGDPIINLVVYVNSVIIPF